MNDPLPRTVSRPIQFQNGCAIGISNRWRNGQYCMILTEAGLVGCGIYDVKTAAEFGQAVAIARGTPQKPLVNPEDLFDARIVDATPQARPHQAATVSSGSGGSADSGGARRAAASAVPIASSVHVSGSSRKSA